LKDELGDLNEDEDQEEINYEDMAENIREFIHILTQLGIQLRLKDSIRKKLLILSRTFMTD